MSDWVRKIWMNARQGGKTAGVSEPPTDSGTGGGEPLGWSMSKLAAELLTIEKSVSKISLLAARVIREAAVRLEGHPIAFTDGVEDRTMRLPVGTPYIPPDSGEHCIDCCCARSWAALGITEYTGKSIPEHIEELRGANKHPPDTKAEAAREERYLTDKQKKAHLYGEFPPIKEGEKPELFSTPTEELAPKPEVIQLREALEAIVQLAWEGGDIDGGDFHCLMVKHGLFVEVPADEEFKAEWDCDTMFVLSWKAGKPDA